MATARSLAFITALLIAAPLAAAEGDKLRPALDYGHTGRAPQMLTASEKPDQIRLSAVLRASVHAKQGGEKLGDVEAVLLDENGQVALVRLDTNDAVIPWSSIELVPGQKPSLAVALTREDLANAALPEKRERFLDAAQFVGKDALGAGGEKLGTVRDAIATLGEGPLVAIVVAEEKALRSDPLHALAWSAVKGRNEQGAILLDIGKEQLAQAPVLTTKAPESTTREAPATPQAGSSGTRGTLDTGGSSAPVETPRR